MRIIRVHIALLFVLCVAILPCLAQDTISLHTADVISAAEVRSLGYGPSQVLTKSDLQRLPTEQVADAMRFFAGVQVKDYGGLGGLRTIDVRGMGTHQVGVTYDGIPVTNAQNGVVDLGRFSALNIESLHLYNGNAVLPLLSASELSSGSVVSIGSGQPYFRGAEKTHVRAGLRAGSYGTFQPSLLLERKVSDRLSLQAQADYLWSEGNYHFRHRVNGAYDTTLVRSNSDVKTWHSEMAMYLKTDDNDGLLSVRGYLYASARGLPGAVVRNRTNSTDRQWDTNAFVQAMWHKSFSTSWQMRIRAKAGYDYLHYFSDGSTNGGFMSVDNRFRQYETFLSMAHQVRLLPALSLSFAADYRYNRLRSDLQGFAFPQRHTLLSSLGADAAFGRLNLRALVLATFVTDETRKSQGDTQRRAELSPCFIATSEPFPDTPLRLHGMYKRIIRMPSLNDLYYTFVGNANLLPERTNQFVVGASCRLPLNLQAKVEYYHNTVWQKIVAIPASNPFRWTMMNLGRVQIDGVETSVAGLWTLRKTKLRLRANYTYEHAIDVTNPAEVCYRHQIPYIPRHSAGITAGLERGCFSLDYAFIYTGDRYDQKANIPENFVPAWYTSDLMLSFRKPHYEVSVAVNNLFDQAYEVVKGYPFPGRHYFLKFIYSL